MLLGLNTEISDFHSLIVVHDIIPFICPVESSIFLIL